MLGIETPETKCQLPKYLTKLAYEVLDSRSEYSCRGYVKHVMDIKNHYWDMVESNMLLIKLLHLSVGGSDDNNNDCFNLSSFRK